MYKNRFYIEKIFYVIPKLYAYLLHFNVLNYYLYIYNFSLLLDKTVQVTLLEIEMKVFYFLQPSYIMCFNGRNHVCIILSYNALQNFCAKRPI